MILTGLVRIATKIEQTAGHHWYYVFMRYAPSANGITHLIVTYYDHCIIVLLFISFAVNMFLCLCLSCISLRWKHASPVVTWFGFKWVPKSSPWPQPQQGNTTNSTSTHLKGFARCLVYAKCRVWRSISSVLAQHTAHATAWCVLEPLGHSKSNAWAGHHGKKR